MAGGSASLAVTKHLPGLSVAVQGGRGTGMRSACAWSPVFP